MENGAGLVQFYRNNPAIAAYDLLKVDLASIQRVILSDMWFKNYCITVAGRGLGKSQWIHSLSYMGDKGLVYLNEELPPIPTYLKDGEDEVISWNDKILTSDGFKQTKRLCLEKGIEGKRTETQNGFINKGSNHHSLLTINKDYDFVYKSLDDFVSGDKVCIQRGQNIFGDNAVSEDDAYLIGLFIGDGCISAEYNHQSITTSDNSIKEFCIDYCKYNNVSYRIDKDKRTDNTVKVVFKRFDYFFDKYKIGRTLSYYRSVPYSIRTAIRGSQVAFLQGYFDADGTVQAINGGVSCCSVSRRLLQEIQLMLLNVGIVARLREKNTNSDFGKAYLLDMFSEDAFKFKELVGFRLDRKQRLLIDYFETKKLNPNKDTIPYVLRLCSKISKYYYNIYKVKNKPSLIIKLSNKKELTYSMLHRFMIQCKNIINNGFDLNEVKDGIEKLYNILYYNYYFDTVVSVDEWKGDCYDFEMDMSGEPNYFTNGFINHNTFLLGVNAVLHALLYPGYRVGLLGPSFRQSKMIFSEVEKLYQRAPILREATEKKPTRGADTCFLKFRGTEISNGSYIEALPIGVDGAKIRGSRFYLIEIDELAQMPPDIIDMVIRPMAAVHLEPMQKVREIERVERLIEEGLATEDDLIVEAGNKMIMTSSGYFKFNHMWHRMKSYWKAMREDGEKTRYAVHQIPYQMLPKGFLDMSNINEARRTMSSLEFRMEYEAVMASDSEGFFKASLLEVCTRGSDFTIQLRGEPGKEYLLGIDPNQGGSALFGLIVIELGYPNKIVYVKGLKKQAHQEMTKAVQRLLSSFNVKRIYMDAQGGGNAIKDLLAEGYNNSTPILDMDDDLTKYKAGRRILRVINFSPSWISDANFDTLSLLENNRLRFPDAPRSSAEVEERMYEQVKLLKSQMLNIIVTETARGVRHFDTPRKGQNKDLYSALILAAYGAKELTKDLEYVEPKLEGEGLVRPHRAGASFTRQKGGVGDEYMQAAVLQRKL